MVLSALVIGFIQVVGSMGASQNEPDRRALDAFAFFLLLVGPLFLTVRDRRPVLALGVTVVAVDVYLWSGYPYGPIFFGLIVAIFSAVGAGHRRATWTWVGGGYLGIVLASLVAPNQYTETGFLQYVLVAGWLSGFVAVAEVFRIRREQIAQQRQARISEAERKAGEQRLHLAQELHDVLAHNISLINVQASVALHLLDDKPDRARPALTAIKGASREALTELRTALDVLRRGDAAPRTPAPRLTQLDSLIEGVRAGGLEVRYHHDLPVPPLSGAVELAAYRIVQEALTNVTRHANADSVTVSVSYGDEIVVEIVDDGVGGVVTPGSGMAGMRRRAESVGGTFEAGPASGGGFRVAARLPVERP